MQDLLSAIEKYFKHQFDAVINIHVTDRNIDILIDGRHQQPTCKFHGEDCRCDCHWYATEQTLRNILKDVSQFQLAFASGKLRINGDMSVMARLQAA